jgi:hypothetical protein
MRRLKAFKARGMGKGNDADGVRGLVAVKKTSRQESLAARSA